MLGHDDAVRSVVHSKDGKKLYSAGSDGKILIWDMDGSRSNELVIKNNYVNRVVDISADESWLALGSDNNEILLFNLNSMNSEPKKLKGHSGSVFDLVFLPDNSGFISSSSDDVIRLNDFNTNTEIAKVSSRVKALAISPDGKTLAGGTEGGDVLLWDLSNQNEQRQLYDQKGSSVSAIAFSSDGKQLVYGDDQGSLKVWNLVEKSLTKTLTGHSSLVTDLKFNSDNTLLASSSYDGTANIWVMQYLNDLPIVLDDHGTGTESKKWVWSVSFNPDGKSLVTGAGDSNIRIWPIAPTDMANEICTYLTANMSETTWDAYVSEDIDHRDTCEGLPTAVDE
jgi:WD40 repeat protein